MEQNNRVIDDIAAAKIKLLLEAERNAANTMPPGLASNNSGGSTVQETAARLLDPAIGGQLRREQGAGFIGPIDRNPILGFISDRASDVARLLSLAGRHPASRGVIGAPRLDVDEVGNRFGLDDLSGLQEVAGLLDDMSYGFGPVQGKGMTARLDPRVADLADVTPIGKAATTALLVPKLLRQGASNFARLPKFTPAPAGSLSEADRAIETRFAAQINNNLEGSIARYNDIPSTRDGKIISVDDARELDPDYVRDRSLSTAVHEPASAFSKVLWERKLAGAGERPIMLMSGGTGAGKTTGLERLGVENYHTVFDSNLANFDKAVTKIDEALASGRDVDIMHVWRDPVEAFSGREGSAITRAMKNNGNGRTVPISAHIDTHVGSNITIKRLKEHYAGDERVEIFIEDNSLGKGNNELRDVSIIEDIDPQELERTLNVELEKAFSEGRINQKTYEGFKESSR